ELMQEQQRAAKSKKKGEKSIDQRKWPTIVSKAKALRAEETSGKKKSAIEQRKSDLTERLSELYLPEVIIPTFSLEHRGHSQKTLIQISNGSVGYESHKPILSKIYFQLESAQRIAIEGANGSGKSTFIKAILQDTKTYRGGEWYSIKRNDIGYLDQHYGTLPEDLTVLDCAREYAPNWSIAEVRFHLSTFLFRKNEEVATQVKHLSGGEKARLSLALLAICTPNLLILDEVSNNLDLETKTHVTEVLNCYPGAIIAISHDQAFLKELRIDEIIDIEKWRSIED
ncbi:MAG: ABC-F family ATP-binding cassette domain-containing protein, partial [Gammaproteobacteria bacterium]|nr:ABC-F family ATP-binding cassette domain-containing protein [Gammaproteobacteria bacterium]